MYIVFYCTCSNWRTRFLVVSFVQLPRNVLSCRRHCQLQLATQFFHGHMFTIVMAMVISLQKLCIAGLHTSWANLILGFTFCVLSHILREISKALRQIQNENSGFEGIRPHSLNCSYQLPSNVYVDDIIRIIIWSQVIVCQSLAKCTDWRQGGLREFAQPPILASKSIGLHCLSVYILSGLPFECCPLVSLLLRITSVHGCSCLWRTSAEHMRKLFTLL